MPQPVMTIRIRPDGICEVEGPLDNKLLCYGMLEEAKQVVRDYRPAQQPRVLGAAVIPDLSKLRPNGRG